jgi:hypothetical protein
MILKRICLAALVLSLGVAGTAQAAQYSLAAGSGAQLHIGGGLALPIQPAATPAVTGTVFPPLLIPPASPFVLVQGTTAMATGQQITVPAGALHKPAAQKTVGVFFSNPTLYAVATNLDYNWPTAPAVFSVNGRAGPAVTTIAGGAMGNRIRYSPRVVGKRFGGAGTFALAPGAAAGLHAGSPVTIYAIAFAGPATPNGLGGGNPPCTHSALTPAPFPGPDGIANCVGALMDALPTGVAAIGQATGAIVTTPGGIGGLPATEGIAVGKFGTAPAGTVTFAALTGGMATNMLTNMATSDGFPFTTGMITVSAMSAMGAPEIFMISGNDTRTAGGAGTIQMVAGALSARPLSGDNANRGWLRLILEIPLVPTMSPLMQGIMILMLLLVPTVYFGMRARNQAV